MDKSSFLNRLVIFIFLFAFSSHSFSSKDYDVNRDYAIFTSLSDELNSVKYMLNDVVNEKNTLNNKIDIINNRIQGYEKLIAEQKRIIEVWENHSIHVATTDEINKAITFIIAAVTVIFGILGFNGFTKWNQLNKQLGKVKYQNNKYFVWNGLQVHIFNIQYLISDMLLSNGQKAEDAFLFSIDTTRFVELLRTGDVQQIEFACSQLIQRFQILVEQNNATLNNEFSEYISKLLHNGFIAKENNKCIIQLLKLLH